MMLIVTMTITIIIIANIVIIIIMIIVIIIITIIDNTNANGVRSEGAHTPHGAVQKEGRIRVWLLQRDDTGIRGRTERPCPQQSYLQYLYLIDHA